MIENYKTEYAMSFIQLNIILNNLPDDDLQKIPNSFLNEIKKYKSNKYVYKYDYSKPLIEQDMLPMTQELLYYIYIKYLKNKNKLESSTLNIENNFNIKDLFNNRHNKKNDKCLNIIEPKENIWLKLLNKIKNIFKK